VQAKVCEGSAGGHSIICPVNWHCFTVCVLAKPKTLHSRR